MESIQYRLQAVLFAFFSGLINLLPDRVSSLVGQSLGSAFYHLDKRHRQVMLDNLKSAYGSTLTKSEMERLSIRCFQNLGKSVIEMVRLSSQKVQDILFSLSVEGT
jgi:lauroyl/myristoyl acyltransferase